MFTSIQRDLVAYRVGWLHTMSGEVIVLCGASLLTVRASCLELPFVPHNRHPRATGCSQIVLERLGYASVKKPRLYLAQYTGGTVRT